MQASKSPSMLSYVSRLLICALLLGTGPGAAPGAQEIPVGQYICPPCGSPCDKEVHDGKGTCSVCGMQLIRKDEIRNVAILIFDGVQIIDFTGPYEVFGQGPFQVFTVSETSEAITTAMGMSVNPGYSFQNSPPPHVLVVPGGGVHHLYENARVIEWIEKTAEEAEFVLSVCNGAFLLARTGLLDGLTATTFYGLIDELKTFAPKTKVVSDQRFVDNGKIITSAGLSSGIDASLHVISRILGRGHAQRLALHLEYDWRPESGFARAAFADRYLPHIPEPEDAEVRLESTQGGKDRWETRYRVQSTRSAAELLAHVEEELAKRDNWSRAGRGESGSGLETRWTFTDGQGRAWGSVTRIEPVAVGDGQYRITMSVQRKGERLAEGG